MGLCSGRQQAGSSGAWQCSDRTLCSATPSILEDREKGLSYSVGMPSRGCLAQLVGDLGTYKGLVGGEEGEEGHRPQGLGKAPEHAFPCMELQQQCHSWRINREACTRHKS